MNQDRSNLLAVLLAALLAVTCFFGLFWRLDGTNLWRDETTTANWARTMARDNSLVPLVFDGETLAVQGFDAHDFNEHLTPGMQGWLQFYVAAISFELFGVSTFTARIPFALLGLVSVIVLWRIGRKLYPASNLAFLFPFMALSSIWFLGATRQTRYYGLVYLFGSLAIYEFIRWLERRELASDWKWYLRISLWSAGVYLSNYLAFAGLYSALCLFVLLTRDFTFLKRWAGLTAILAVLFGVEFFSFHFDFASSWSAAGQPWENESVSIWDKLRIARNMHEEELFRMIPFVLLIPGAFYVSRREYRLGMGPGIPIWAAVCAVGLALVLVFGKGTGFITWIGIFVVLALCATGILVLRSLRAGEGTAPTGWRNFVLLALLLGAAVAFGFGVEHTAGNNLLILFSELAVGGLFVFGVLRLRPKAGEPMEIRRGAILLLLLTMVIGVVVTIGVGLDKGLVRYYYQVTAAAQMFAALVAAEILRRGQKAVGAVFLIGMMAWPNLAWNIQSSFGIVERQFLLTRNIDWPVIDYLRANTRDGDRIVFYRNVQGMMFHFYLPELQWVGQLDSVHPGALRYRDRLPAYVYDDVEDVDWYVVWDNRGIMPKGLDDSYRKVWEYTYQYPMPWWDVRRGVRDQRTWRIYKKIGPEGSTATTGL